MSKRVAIFVSGGGSNMVALTRAMKAPEFGAKPVLVLANNANAGGLDKAAAMGIATAVVDHRPFKGDRKAFEQALLSTLAPHHIDIICLAGFMRVLTPFFINHWQGRMLNIHPSLLPKYKGLHTHKRAIEAGDRYAGCSVHEVTSELDGGPVLLQARVPIEPDETPDTLAAKVLIEEHRIYPEALHRFANK
jgi:phosphoribosylglycinamide formyltransferase-1